VQKLAGLRIADFVFVWGETIINRKQKAEPNVSLKAWRIRIGWTKQQSQK